MVFKRNGPVAPACIALFAMNSVAIVRVNTAVPRCAKWACLALAQARLPGAKTYSGPLKPAPTNTRATVELAWPGHRRLRGLPIAPCVLNHLAVVGQRARRHHLHIAAQLGHFADRVAELGRFLQKAGQPAVHAGGQDLAHLAIGQAQGQRPGRQLLGEGEVSVIGGSTIQAQESVLAGVWYVRATPDGEAMKEWVEVAAFPPSLLAVAFQDATDELPVEREFPENVFNAPPLIPEINEHLPRIADGELTNHVINLSLLPHTPEDLTYLDAILGKGPLIILSRGYGNCRIRSTGTRNCWWVRYYNSQDTLILNSIELSLIPSVALAAPEDLADSEERLSEIMDIYR